MRLDDLTARADEMSYSSPLGAESFPLSSGRRQASGHDEIFGNVGIAAIFKALAFGVVVTDPRQPDNPIVRVNPAFCAMTGYAAQELIGRNCRLLQGPGTDRESLAGLRAALIKGRTVRRIILNYRKDGTAFWNEMNLSPVRGDDGGLLGYVGIQIDVSEQVRRLQGTPSIGVAPSVGAGAQSDRMMARGALGTQQIAARDWSFSGPINVADMRLALASRPTPYAQDQSRRAILERLTRLSPRERQVLDGIVAGHPNKTIALNLSLSPRTVEVHRSRVMDKMQARNLSELVRLAIGAGIGAAA